jgi:lipopolysaccharide transport system ATP-binding protein
MYQAAGARAEEVAEAYGAFVIAAESMGLSEDAVQVTPALSGASPSSSDEAGRSGLMTVAEDTTTFGTNQARIIGVGLTDAAGRPVGVAQGGAEVVLTLRIKALDDILGAIAGFVVKDRLGQQIFCENTYEPGVLPEWDLRAGTVVDARFRFLMPDLATGRYSITPAIASGTQADHIQHHWVHDALMFDVLPRRFLGAMIGVPMLERSIASSDPDQA